MNWPWAKTAARINLRSRTTGIEISVEVQGPTRKDYEGALSWGKHELERLDAEATAPKKYESWIPIADGDPFPPKIRATILNYRDGWVRYSLPYRPDKRMKLELFIKIYKKEPNNDPG